MIGCKKSILAVLLAFVLALPLMPLSPVEAASSVRVTLPYFPIKINGQTLDQTHSQYPFLYYKDVTYLPLTWNNLQALGLWYGWSEEEGLQVYPNRLPVSETPPVQDLMEAANSGRIYTAQVAQEPIRIGDASIDNSTEPYPFLMFRDVTYMPLTWHFIHDLLQMDIRWSEVEGLHQIGGQHVLGPVIGEDNEALYFESMYFSDPQKNMIRMDKMDFGLQWKSDKEMEILRTELFARDVPYAGKPAKLVRKDRELYYGDVKLYNLTDGDLQELDTWGAPVHTYKEYAAGEDTVIITVNLRISIAVIGPNYGTTYTFLVRRGQVTKLEEFQNQQLGRVIPNPDGTVWIASDRLPSRSSYMPGSARLCLLDTDGKIHMVNELIGRSDVLTLGLNNPMLDNPADQNGSLHMAVYGDYDPNIRKQTVEGVYSINTKLETTLISDQTQGDFYLDGTRTLFVQHGNNTVENLSKGETRTWFDYDLIGMK
jgi:hypothetical protein